MKAKFNSIIGGSEQKEKTLGDEMNEMCSMTRTQVITVAPTQQHHWISFDTYLVRMYGFGICFVLGWVISILSTLFLPTIATQPAKFAVCYTLGNVTALASTCFLWGPCKQLKKMFKPIRVVATCVYLGMIITTFIVAFETGEAILVILCLIIQCLAMIWYAASFIPYGRTIIKKCVGNLCGCKGGDDE